MLQTLEAIQTRRSVKHFDATHKMSEAEIKQLLSLAMLSPTAFNLQHWRFVVVEDAQLRTDIKEVAWHQAQVTDASLFIILCADVDAWNKSPQRYWQHAPQAVQDFILPAIEAYYQNKPQVQRDEALRSCGMAAQTLMLAAKALGYESCPMDGFDFDAVAQLIHLPENHLITMAIAIGKGTQDAAPRAGQLALEEVVIKNRFNA